jgi:hypothetical protein
MTAQMQRSRLYSLNENYGLSTAKFHKRRKQHRKSKSITYKSILKPSSSVNSQMQSTRFVKIGLTGANTGSLRSLNKVSFSSKKIVIKFNPQKKVKINMKSPFNKMDKKLKDKGLVKRRKQSVNS